MNAWLLSGKSGSSMTIRPTRGRPRRRHSRWQTVSKGFSAVFALTGGAFDPGLAEQMDRQRGNAPDAASPPAHAPRGRLLMDPENFTVCSQEGPVALDLGAIGKGFALDRMGEELETWDVRRALLVAGGSSILALDGPQGTTGWEVTIHRGKTLLLERCAVGASGTAVKGAHILDPRTGEPASTPVRAWAVHPSAAVADALSTAWMLLDADEIGQVCRQLPGSEAFLEPAADDAPPRPDQV
jgi:thiamine biosynthesis lipoprotein